MVTHADHKRYKGDNWFTLKLRLTPRKRAIMSTFPDIPTVVTSIKHTYWPKLHIVFCFADGDNWLQLDNKHSNVPCRICLLARTMMRLNDALKIKFCPQLSRAKLVVVLSEAFSYSARSLSYLSASYCSLLKYWKNMGKTESELKRGIVLKYLCAHCVTINQQL